MSDLLTHRPAAGDVGPTTDPLRRPLPSRRRVWALLSVALVVVGGALVSLPSTVGFAQGATPRFNVDVEQATLPRFEEQGVHALGYEDGQPVTLTIPVRNDGPFPVEVEAVVLDERPLPMLDQVATGSRRGALPFRLGAGGSVEVHLSFAFDNCEYYTERAIERYPSVTVHYTVAGIAGTREVAFDHPVVVRSPMMVSCPQRVGDRGYNRRNA